MRTPRRKPSPPPAGRTAPDTAPAPGWAFWRGIMIGAALMLAVGGLCLVLWERGGLWPMR